MNAIEAALLDLVQVAESPLYSTYRWLGREIGRDLSMTEFCRLVDRLIDEQVVRLWAVDPASEERTEVRIPDDLERRYEQLGDALDASFDPFGLSLTLGPRADVDAEPDWSVDLDLDSSRFQVDARPGQDEEALGQLGLLLPDVALVEEERVFVNDRIRISGSATVAPGGCS